MTQLSRFLLGVWEFVVGDDPLTAVGVILALGVTAALASAGVSAFWVLPAAVVLLLAQALARAARS